MLIDAWILDESPGTYRWGQIELPPPTGDQVQLRVVASALNHMDLWLTKGMPKPHVPHVPGCDVAGVVESVGDLVDGIGVGVDDLVGAEGRRLVELGVVAGGDHDVGAGVLGEGQRRGRDATAHADDQHGVPGPQASPSQHPPGRERRQPEGGALLP